MIVVYVVILLIIVVLLWSGFRALIGQFLRQMITIFVVLNSLVLRILEKFWVSFKPRLLHFGKEIFTEGSIMVFETMIRNNTGEYLIKYELPNLLKKEYSNNLKILQKDLEILKIQMGNRLSAKKYSLIRQWIFDEKNDYLLSNINETTIIINDLSLSFAKINDEIKILIENNNLEKAETFYQSLTEKQSDLKLLFDDISARLHLNKSSMKRLISFHLLELNYLKEKSSENKALLMRNIQLSHGQLITGSGNTKDEGLYKSILLYLKKNGWKIDPEFLIEYKEHILSIDGDFKKNRRIMDKVDYIDSQLSKY